MATSNKKYQTVIKKNTFYFSNQDFQQKYDGYINSIVQTLLLLKSQIEIQGLRKKIFEDLLYHNENGLRAILALTGFANEKVEKRTMDFIIPNKINPKIIIENSFLVTTSSGQGDKSKTEGNVRKLISKILSKSKIYWFC